jgi:hypothetical protein
MMPIDSDIVVRKRKKEIWLHNNLHRLRCENLESHNWMFGVRTCVLFSSFGDIFVETREFLLYHLANLFITTQSA